MIRDYVLGAIAEVRVRTSTPDRQSLLKSRLAAVVMDWECGRKDRAADEFHRLSSDGYSDELVAETVRQCGFDNALFEKVRHYAETSSLG